MINSPGLLGKYKSELWGAVVSVLFVIAFYPALKILVTKWMTSDEYSHAFLVVPVILYIVWSKRNRLHQGTSAFSSPGLLLTVISIALYVFALLTQVHTIILLAMFFTLVGMSFFLIGLKNTKEIFTALLLLLMLIPVPDQLYTSLTFPLQLKVSEVSEVILRFLHVPMFREGNVMHVPKMSFEVVEACSGLRSVVALMTLSVLAGYFTLNKWPSKIVLFVSSVPLAIFVNIIRVLSMMLLYYYFGLDLTIGVWHTITGLLVFVVAIIVLFFLQRVLEFWEQKSKKS